MALDLRLKAEMDMDVGAEEREEVVKVHQHKEEADEVVEQNPLRL